MPAHRNWWLHLVSLITCGLTQLAILTEFIVSIRSLYVGPMLTRRITEFQLQSAKCSTAGMQGSTNSNTLDKNWMAPHSCI
ncbi:hypothetical protein BDZ91DRAFT_359037 [Kalaharituber pfeilii]|nr:hypothetical protein BDZ91DRAFT_359037 [Kalaharituber pfeilii]